MGTRESDPGLPGKPRIRPARAADHGAFARLFPELRVDDPVVDQAVFSRELVPTTVVAVVVEGDGEPGGARNEAVVGYAYFQLMGAVAYVRHIVSAPEARRAGVGRALMAAIEERASAAGCTSWCLNVKPDNAPAIALYERLGFRAKLMSKAMKMAWTLIDDLVAADAKQPAAPIEVLAVEAADDAAVEAESGLLPGQLAAARALGDRVLLAARDGTGAIVGATVFAPKFPGAYPFRAADFHVALRLLRAMRPHAIDVDRPLNIVCEGQPELADALLRAGATLKLDILHMVAPLRGGPSPSG